MNLIHNFSSYVFSIILILFCIPFALPNYELSFILIQFSFLSPIFLFLSLFKTDFFGIFMISIYFFLILLLPFGVPGSFLGWMAMVCAGYLFGSKASREGLNVLYELKYFVLLSIILSLWIVIKNYQNVFSYELLSDYFEVSSINTVPLLLVSLTNIFCSYYYYLCYFNPKINLDRKGLIKTILLALLAVSTLLVILFEFRSGVGIFILLALVLWKSLGSSYFHILLKTIILISVTTIILYFGRLIYEFMAILLVPGRSDILLVFDELLRGSLRFERMINFWNISAFSKLELNIWSSNLSVSGMSDMVSGLFPISLLFFIPCLSCLKITKYILLKNRIPLLIILISAASSFMMSLLQPDFFSMFSFFAIMSLIYFGKKNKKGIRD